MSSTTLAFCIGLPILFAAIAVVTHLVQCHQERLHATCFSQPMDYEVYHFGPAHKAFIDSQGACK